MNTKTWPYPCGCTLHSHLASTRICDAFPACAFGRAGTPASRMLAQFLEQGILERNPANAIPNR